MSVSNITNAELEDATRSFVSIESAATISRKHVRQRLEEIFKLDKGALYSRKDEINDIVQKILRNLLEQTYSKTDKNIDEQENEEREQKIKKEKEADTKESQDEEASSKKRKLLNAKDIYSIKKKQAKIMTKDHFLENASSLTFDLCKDVHIDMKPRVFNTGSCGWHVTEKSYIPVGNKDVLCHVCFNITVLSSKEWE